MSNIYSNPEDFGLSIVKSHDTVGGYGFNTVIVFRWDGWGPVKYFVAHDSGCSCPMPFDNVKLPHLVEVRTLADVDRFAREKWADLNDLYYGDDEDKPLDQAVAALMDGLRLPTRRGSAPNLGRAVAGMQAVEAHYTDGGLFGAGRVIAYYAVPTYVIQRPDGSRFSWRADMTYALADESTDIAAATARAQAAIHQQLDNA